jgi:glycyl-tRNA synthetase beta chain
VGTLVERALAGYTDQNTHDPGDVMTQLATFLFERLQYVFEARGADRRNIRAVVPSPGVALAVPVSDLHENLRALPEFARSEQFRQLATAFKRVRNIAKDSPVESAAPDGAWSKVLKEAAERALLQEIAKRQPAIQKAVASGTGFRDAYAEAAGFEPAVARFFNEVFVMADDPALRKGRLRLMKELEHLILQLGDISEVVASES